MPLNEATTLSNNTLSDFDLSESVSAAYAMGNLSFGFVTVTPGLRYEHTRLELAASSCRMARPLFQWRSRTVMMICSRR